MASDEELQTLINEVETQTIDYLFDKVYERLESPERSLLNIASLFHLKVIGSVKTINRDL